MQRWALKLRGPHCHLVDLSHRQQSLSHLSAPRNSSVASLLSSISSSDASQPRDVTVNGFVRSVRKQKRVAFAHLGDGSSLDPLQVVLSPEQAEALSVGVAVRIFGQWSRSLPGKEQNHELHAKQVTLLGDHDSTSYPLQKKYHSPEFLRTLPQLRPRIPHNALLLRLRSQVIASLTSFFVEHDFVQTHPPIITSSDCEGAGEVFAVVNASDFTGPQPNIEQKARKDHFFRTPKYLTVSSQLHLEALAQAVTKVWTLSPTFRAEKNDTPRHLSEFYMLEAEICFTDNLESVMTLVESMLRHVAHTIQTSTVGEELLKARTEEHARPEQDDTTSEQELKGRWAGMASACWPRLRYHDAIELLQKAAANGQSFEHEPTYGSALQAEHEKFLAREIGQGRPIFVTDYPRDIKAFYMAPSDSVQRQRSDSDTVACFDLLVPDLCELAGGSLREHRVGQLLAAMKRLGLVTSNSESSSKTDNLATSTAGSTDLSVASNLQWYLDLRRYGSVPHGGFGLGFDRLLSYLSGVPNVREVVTFPRWYGRCDC